MNIYNKKRFLLGVITLMLGIVLCYFCVSSIAAGNRNIVLLAKDVVIALACILVSVGAILTSVDKKAEKKAAIEEKDERNKLVDLHVSKAVNTVMLYFEAIVLIVFALIWYIYKNQLLLIPVIAMGLCIGVSFLSTIIASAYYERKL